MPKTLSDVEIVSDIDRVLLAEARSVLGAPSESETVNEALAALIREHRRRSAVEHEIRRFESGAYGAGGAGRAGARR